MRPEPAAGAAGPGERRLLVLAYKFPDLILPGGSTRVEKLVKYLPAPWAPVVLSVEVPDGALAEPVHRGPRVHRTPSHYGAFAQAYRAVHLRQGGGLRRGCIQAARLVKNLVLVPDDAVLWWPRAYPAARRLARTYSAEALFASGPPYSGLVLCALLSRSTGLPFVADLRDDWAGNPLAGRRNPTQALTEFPLERWTLRQAARVIHVTEASRELYRRRYPKLAERMVLLRNGYDEEDFDGAAPRRKEAGELLILHAGSLKDGRDPAPLLRAMALLAARGERYRRIRFVQLGTTHRAVEERAAGYGVGDQAEWRGPVPRAEAARRMGEADALLLLPTPEAPTAVPGKAYEYLRAGRPVLVLSGENETTRFLGAFPGVAVRAPDDTLGLAQLLAEWFESAEVRSPDPAAVLPYSRRSQAAELASLLDAVRAEAARGGSRG